MVFWLRAKISSLYPEMYVRGGAGTVIEIRNILKLLRKDKKNYRTMDYLSRT